MVATAARMFPEGLREPSAGSLLLPPAVWWHPASLSEPAGEAQAAGCPSFC